MCGVNVVDARPVLDEVLRVISRVSFVIFDGFEVLDLTGPFEVFQQANRLSGRYSCEVVSRAAGPVRSDSGLCVQAEFGVRDRDPQGIDTLVVAGGSGVDLACDDPRLVAWVGSAGTEARRGDLGMQRCIRARRGRLGLGQARNQSLEPRVATCPGAPGGRSRLRSDLHQGWPHLDFARAGVVSASPC